MKMLALETSGFSGSLALLRDGEPIDSNVLSPEQRTAQFLAPAIQSLLAQNDWNVKDVNLLGVTHGPGSFTGLRVGITTTKVLAYAIGAEVVAVNTLEAFAWQVPGSYQRLDVVMDAQRKGLFVASFQRLGANFPNCTMPTKVLPVQDWVDSLTGEVHVTGPAIEKLTGVIPKHVGVASEPHRHLSAETVGRLAGSKYDRGQSDNIWTLVPQYYRESAAEEKYRQ